MNSEEFETFEKKLFIPQRKLMSVDYLYKTIIRTPSDIFKLHLDFYGQSVLDNQRVWEAFRIFVNANFSKKESSYLVVLEAMHGNSKKRAEERFVTFFV